MTDTGKVKVTIGGHDYTISGGAQREHVLRVADYVDGVLTDISEQAASIPPASLGVLTAVNITDTLFREREQLAAKDGEKEQLEKDIAHYIQLWEEAKRNLIQYKDDAQAAADELAGVQEKLNEKAIENDRLLKAAAEKDRRIAELTEEKSRAITDLTDKKDRQIEELTKERDGRVAQITAEKDQRIEELTRERNQRIASLTAEKDARIEELGGQVTALNGKVQELSRKLQEYEEGKEYSIVQIKETEDKYKELEGNYFEIQMENIRLKGEIERLNSLLSE
jgi:cell division protein ZapA (FtsZ GTPase activity inhibitor)